MPDNASAWLDALLERVQGSNAAQRRDLAQEAATLPPAVQIGVLRECVRRMPSLKSDDYHSPEYAAGSVLYDIACLLYAQKLPYTEDDVCALLEASEHTCGHGGDVTPPLDIAHAYLRKHGFSERIVGAVRVYLANLRGVGSSRANSAKRRAAIMLLADPTELPHAESGWTAYFRSLLRDLPGNERRAWQRFILAMKANDVYVQPVSWRKSSNELLTAVSPRGALARAAGWIRVGDNAALRVIKTGGSHTLKHLVWLLAAIGEDQALRTSCDELVADLAKTDWTPKERATKFMKAAAYYLVERPPDVAWSALNALSAWNGDADEKLRGIIQRYGIAHGLVASPDPPSSVGRWIATMFRTR